MFSFRKYICFAVIAAASMCAVSAPAQTSMDPAALQLLKDISNTLVKFPALGFRANFQNLIQSKSGKVDGGSYDINMVFKRPDQFRLTMKKQGSETFESIAVSDGRQMYTYSRNGNAYMMQPAPEEFRGMWMASGGNSLRVVLPFLMEFLTPDPLRDWINSPFSADFKEKDASAGYMQHRAGYIIKKFGFANLLEVQLSANEIDGLFPARLTAMKPEIGCNQKLAGKEGSIIIEFKDWNTNPVIKEDTFEFVPPPGARMLN